MKRAAPGRRQPRRRPPAFPAVLAVAGLVLAVGAPLAWRATRPASDVGAALAVPQTPAVPAAAPGLPRQGPTTHPDADPRAAALTAVRVRDAAPAPVRHRDAPVEILLPRQGRRAPVSPTGVTGDGSMALPADVDRVGWYRFGPSPGDPSGTAVLAGHVDDAAQGLGVLSLLTRMRPGDPVVVRLASGRTLTYTVVGRHRYPKQRLPLDAVFARSGAPRLVLVTCGGPFDARARHYRDNVVVHAEPRP